jgi:putative transposase
VCLVIFWRLRYQLSLRDLAEMFLQRGIGFTHEAVRDWEAKLALLLSDSLRKRRSGAVGNSWYVAQTQHLCHQPPTRTSCYMAFPKKWRNFGR